MSEIVLAVDLGGTNIRMAAVSADGTIHVSARGKTPPDVSPAQLIDLTGELVNECVGKGLSMAEVTAFAYAAPAPAAKANDGVLTRLPNLPTLDGMPLSDLLFERFSLPVILENDATAAAIGEAWLGASRTVENSLMVTLGTGVGGGLILNREPYRGIDGTAGEIGHICVEPAGHPCGCGSRGCVEQYASATAVVRMANEAGIRVDSARELHEKAVDGDEAAAAVFHRMGSYLGIMLAGLINTINPEMIVLGGGLSAGWDAFLGAVHDEIRNRSFKAPAERVRLARAELGDDAGIIGAARTAFLIHRHKH
jgi:glucokinase